jgi:aspartate/methionine/tyrosine aminotransferase
MDYKRMPIEIESPEQMGYGNIKFNLTESSVRDALFPSSEIDLNNLLLSYGDHKGKIELRQLIAKETKTISPEQVLITPSAATALFVISTTLLDSKSHLIVVRPNYATNIETPKAIGCAIDYLDVQFEDGFKINWDRLGSLIKPNTKLISITHPHNPTGICLSPSDFVRLTDIANSNGAYILVDETYRELNRVIIQPYAADLNKKMISVASMSKGFGLPGIRIGWLLTQDQSLMEKFFAAKEQIIICNSIIDEEIGYHFYKNKKDYLHSINLNASAHFSIVKSWMDNQNYLEWIEPQGGVVCFPRIKSQLKVDYKLFYADLNSKFGTFVGPGHWFDMSENYMRIGFGYPLKEELIGGLDNITKAIKLQLE